MKFIREMVKHMERLKNQLRCSIRVKINPVVRKIQNYGNKWIQYFRLIDKDRLLHLVMKYQPYGRRSQG
jgi:uncharacterized coiled-coil DUF342 family protein